MKNHLEKISLFILTSSLFFGGLGGQNFNFMTTILVLFTIAFLIFILIKKSLSYPPGFYLYMIFLIFFALNLFWTKNFWITYWYLLLFACGFFFWTIAYNLKNELKHFDKIIISLGVIFGMLALLNYFKNPLLMDSFSLHKMATTDHHHIGDLWSVIFPILIVNLFKENKKKLIWLLLLPLGFFLFYISQSRTAIISLLVGSVYLFQNLTYLKKYKQVLYLFIFLGLFLFLFFAGSKPTLPNRGYYLQGIAGIIHHPIGIGIGNFGLLSGDQENHIFGFSGFSSVGMNILMEIFAGMGVFGIIFLIWFIKILSSVFEQNQQGELIYKTIFLTLTVVFMLDFAYLVPTMLWLWFISLGLSQKNLE